MSAKFNRLSLEQSGRVRFPQDLARGEMMTDNPRSNHTERRTEWTEKAQGDGDLLPDLDEFIELSKSRRVVRAFRTDPVPEDVIQGVLEAANWAPSGANSQPWHFIVIRDDETKEEMADIFRDEIRYKGEVDPAWPGAGNSREFIDAPVVIVVAGDTRKERWWPQVLDGSREKLFQQSMAAAVTLLHMAAASAGLAATWVTTRPPSEHRLKNLLDIPAWMRIGSTAPIGYPDLENAPMVKSRSRLARKIHEERFKEEQMPDLESIIDGIDSWRERVYRPEHHDIEEFE